VIDQLVQKGALELPAFRRGEHLSRLEGLGERRVEFGFFDQPLVDPE
jgi:hypothetical protein